MPVNYIPVDDAIEASGLRMMVVTKVPSPWGEAAKGIFHVKNIAWNAVALVYDNPKLAKWAGGLSGPIAVYNDENPRSGWAEILMLAERLSPENPLIPDDPKARMHMFGMSHEIFGEEGLCWGRRILAVHSRFANDSGFPAPIAQYLAHKYGYTPATSAAAAKRVPQLLELLANRLRAQSEQGSEYFIGETLTALDIYSACAMALFAPLPEDVCAMLPHSRDAFTQMDDATSAALDPVLLKHRDMIYARHLELPLTL